MKYSILLHLVSFAGDTALEVYSTPEPIEVDDWTEAEKDFKRYKSGIAAKAQHAASGNSPDVLTVYPREQKYDECMITATTWRNTIARVYLLEHE
jgi:hypothetical protein